MTHCQKLAYIALGGLLMLVGMITTAAFMPSLVAQSEDATGVFKTVICNELLVGRHKGSSILVFIDKDTDEPRIRFVDKNRKTLALIESDELGGSLILYARTGKGASALGINADNSGFVTTRDAFGNIGLYDPEYEGR